MNLTILIWTLILLTWIYFVVRNIRSFNTRHASQICLYIAGLFISYICLTLPQPLPILPWEKSAIENQILRELKRVSQELGTQLHDLDMEIHEPVLRLKEQLQRNLGNLQDDQRLQDALNQFAQAHKISVLLYDGQRSFHSSNWPFALKELGLQLAYSMAITQTPQKTTNKPSISKALVQETLKSSSFHADFLRHLFEKPNELLSVPGKMFGESMEAALWTYLLDPSKKFHLLVLAVPPEALLEIYRKKLDSMEKWASHIGSVSTTIETANEKEFKESIEYTDTKFRLQTPLVGSNNLLLTLEVDTRKFIDGQMMMTLSAQLILLILPFLIELFAYILTLRLTKMHVLLEQNSNLAKSVNIPRGYQKEFEIALHAKVFKKLRAIRTVTQIEGLIAWGKRRVVREDYLANDSFILNEEVRLSVNRSQLVFYLGLIFIYGLALFVGFLIVAYLDYDQTRKDWEGLLISRDKIISQVDRAGPGVPNRDLLAKIQISLRPYLNSLELLLRNGDASIKTKAGPLPLKDNASLILSHKQREIYSEGRDFSKELGSNWKRMYLLGIRHGDIYFHKFSTPLYSYPLDSTDFIKSRNQFEILSNQGLHFLRYFYQDEDYALLLLIKLNTIPSDDLKKLLISHLIRLETKVVLSDTDTLRWNQRTLNRGYHLHGLLYQTNFDPFSDFLKKLHWAHIFFVCLVVFLKIQGGTNLFKLKREIRFYLNALLFLTVLSYLYFIYYEIQGSSQDISIRDQMFKERQSILHDVRLELQSASENIQTQIKNWFDRQSEPFPFKSQAGYILFSRRGVLQQDYSGLNPFESRLLIGMALELLQNNPRQPEINLFSQCTPPKFPWPLKHLDKSKSARRLARDLLKTVKDFSQIPTSLLNTPAGPMLLVVSSQANHEDSSMLVCAIPERNLAKSLNISQKFESSLDARLEKVGLLLGILDIQEADMIYKNDWSLMPADLNSFLRSGTGDPSPWATKDTTALWRYEILPGIISNEIRIVVAWKEEIKTSSPYEGLFMGFPLASLAFLAGIGILMGINRSMSQPLHWIRTTLQHLLIGHPPPHAPKNIFGEFSTLISKFNHFLGTLDRGRLPPLPPSDLLELVEQSPSENSSLKLKTAIMEIYIHENLPTQKISSKNQISLTGDSLQLLMRLVEESGGMIFQQSSKNFLILFSSENLNRGSQSGIEIGLKMLRSWKSSRGAVNENRESRLLLVIQEAEIELNLTHGDGYHRINFKSQELEKTQTFLKTIDYSLEGVFIPENMAEKFKFAYDLNPLKENAKFIEILDV